MVANLSVVFDTAVWALCRDVQTDRHLEPFYGTSLHSADDNSMVARLRVMAMNALANIQDVQGHSRSLISVHIGSPYVTS